jgi:uncharacterized membrane protein YfcA
MHDLPAFLAFAAVGFVAQMIDGMLGMAYGITSTSLLLTLGLPPAVASATAHAAECLTTGASAASHYKFGNVDWRLVKRLAFTGVVGAVTGAYILVRVPGNRMKPFIAAYLLIMGVIILMKAWKQFVPRHVESHVSTLGLAGGFFDAIGGGGWGPIVTGTLLARGNEPRKTIGSVDFSEFFVTVAASITFFATIGLKYWLAIAGLATGGVAAAPIAAYLCHKVPARPMMACVGVLVIALSIRTIVLALR